MPKKGSKRRKTRTHVKPTPANQETSTQKVPKSFVIKSGVVGPTVAGLTRDLRKVLEPNTASRIKERKSNRLRDFVAMSGPLGVTHMLVLSQPTQPSVASISASSSNNNNKENGTKQEEYEVPEKTTVNLRLIRLPRGPTLTFKVLRYSLSSDILRSARRPRSIGREFAEAPLLILSGFGGESKELSLMRTVFQNLFPAIHVQTMPLSSARRVVLLSYNPTTKTIEWRHYIISVRPVGVSKPIRKIIGGSTSAAVASSLKRRRIGSAASGTDESASEAEEEEVDGTGEGAVVPRASGNVGGTIKAKAVVDLSRAEDISDYILRHEGMGYTTSDSEMSDASSVGSGGSSDDERRGKVRLGADYIGRGNRGRGIKGEKRAVRLVELGPRMELGLLKIEEGLGEGEVLFHEIVHKSAAEASKLSKEHAERRKLQKQRREEQAANVAAKKAAKEAAAAAKEEKKKVRMAAKEGGGEEDEEQDESDSEDENAIDSDNSFDYDREHGLMDAEENVSEGGVSDDESEGEDVKMAGSDAEDSSDEDEEVIDPEYSDDDSDLSPIPYNSSDDEDDSPSEDEAEPPRKKQVQGKRSGAMSFKHKGFKKQDRGPAKPAVGIFLGRPEKKEKGKGVEEDDEGKRGGGGFRGGRGRGGFDKRGGGRGGRGGRGARGRH
ncbi:Brix-domain-containing protein [Meredithblackwellia eburnea MCA 4105]